MLVDYVINVVMAQLFDINDKVVFPHAETLMIEPFKEIWERDKSKGKEIALKEFAYIEFISSMRKTNPYKGYSEKEKSSKIIKDLFKDTKWKPDTLVLQGINKVKEFQMEASVTYSYFLAVKESVEKIKEFLKTVNLAERNFKTGMPVYKPKELTSALVDTEKVLANLKSIESKVEEELFEETRNKANKEISLFADPESLNM